MLDHKLEVLNHQYSYKALVPNPDDNLKNVHRLSAVPEGKGISSEANLGGVVQLIRRPMTTEQKNKQFET